MFVQLVSVHVNKAVNLFQGKLKEQVYALVNGLRTDANNTKRHVLTCLTHVTMHFSGLAAINMPALIEDELKQERIPASIVQKAEDIRSKGGFHVIEAQEQGLSHAANENTGIISQIRTTLDAEEKSDNALREHYKARWTTTSSTKLTEKFKQEIAKYSGILKTAMDADQKVKAKIRLCERDVALMGGPRVCFFEK
jgi:hypothetical protein